MCMVETDAVSRQSIQLGCVVRDASVGAKGFVAEVIRHDEDDVGHSLFAS